MFEMTQWPNAKCMHLEIPLLSKQLMQFIQFLDTLHCHRCLFWRTVVPSLDATRKHFGRCSFDFGKNERWSIPGLHMTVRFIAKKSCRGLC